MISLPPPDVLEKLIVKRVAIADGESNVVILAKCKSALNKLISAHNQLITLLNFEQAIKEMKEMSHFLPPIKDNALKKAQLCDVFDEIPVILPEIEVPLPVQQRECVDFLLQAGYTCRCVGSNPIKTETAIWCKTCKRLIDEDEEVIPHE